MDDGQQSHELESAVKRFEEVCDSLEDKKGQLQDLEARRRKLHQDLESLRNEIIKEQQHLRSVLDEDHKDELECVETACEEWGDVVIPVTLDTDYIKEFIRIQRNELESAANDVGFEQDKESYLEQSDNKGDDMTGFN